MRIIVPIVAALGLLFVGTASDDGAPAARSDLTRTALHGASWAPSVSWVSTPSRAVQAYPSAGPEGAAPGEATQPVRTSAVDPDEVIQGVCTRCHNERRLQGNLSLESYTVANAVEEAEITERMINKLRAGMMPPPNSRAPEGDTLLQLVETLEDILDRAAEGSPNPGFRSFQRMNRAEYEAAIGDLLGLEIDAESWLPLDQKSANFDNIADAQLLSPTLLESYLNAAAEISRMAVGDVNAPAIEKTYSNSTYLSQHPWDHVEGAPFGTRGGMVVNHMFPADAEYTFEFAFGDGGDARLEDIDISINGERVALVHYERGVLMKSTPVRIPAGQHRLSVAFVRRTEGPYEDLIRPHMWSYAGGGDGGGSVTEPVHIEEVIIGGPFNATGVSEFETRQRIFTCRPDANTEARECAERIVSRMAEKAYRRPLESSDVEGLMGFYDVGAEEEGFELGVRMALEAILASPHFVFRIEREPEGVEPGEAYPLDDLDLASRLSFFLWGTVPDDELVALAAAGELSSDAELERQVRRMLADDRSEALGSRFAYQWLRLQDLYKVRPDPNFFPNFDENLADDMVRETELFFLNLVREDRGALELFDADYTFVNERLAQHYGMPGVAGNDFRRVPYPDETRSGLLGHGSILVLTSLANRTSPVLRGKWVMEVLMGTPPPPPPPGVPELEETGDTNEEGRILTTRERMEIHRANPTCNSCHRFMDPIGLALDNFDVTGSWRHRESGVALDTRGDFYDGTPVSTPRELAEALLKRPLPLVRTFTQNLMAYALGRRVEYFDQPTIRKIVDEAQPDGYRVTDLIVGVVQSDAFRMRRAVAVDEQANSQGGQP